MENIMKILEELRPEFDFSISDDYISDGYLDSFDVISLVSELDDLYNISIDGADIVPENFCNLEAIMAVIKKNGGQV